MAVPGGPSMDEGTRVAVTCDSCPFRRELADSLEAHRLARDHEREHSAHFVSLQVLEAG